MTLRKQLDEAMAQNRDKWLFKVTGLMPKRLMYWCIIKAFAEATTGEFSHVDGSRLTVGRMLETLAPKWGLANAPTKQPRMRKAKSDEGASQQTMQFASEMESEAKKNENSDTVNEQGGNGVDAQTA